MSKINSLSDKLSEILCTAPTLIDPEDDIYEDTAAKVVENDFDVEELDEKIKDNKIHKVNIQLDELDKRYEGVKSSRKNLGSNSCSSENESVDEEETDELDSDVTSDEFNDSESSDENEEFSKISVEAENKVAFQNDDKNFRHLRNTSGNLKKGNCVSNQLKIWENLIEMRIQLQKCLLSANKMPQKDYYHKLKQLHGNKIDDKINITKKSVSDVLDKLLKLQSVLLKIHPETKNLKPQSVENENKDTDNNEEILSDTESGVSESVNENVKEPSDNIKEPTAKKRNTIADYENILQSTHELYKPYRNNVIQNWNEKTRVAVAKNSINANSVVNQIEFILKDKDKCVKRTQLKRSNYEIIGQKRKLDINDSENQLESSVKSGSEYNKEIFDDDDFYHQLLRELIECKSAGVTDPVQLSRQWIELQSARSKMKRKIDTKATKGRKIRYAVHSKLVNFMAPIPDNNWTDEAKTELFSSLFGNKSYVKVK